MDKRRLSSLQCMSAGILFTPAPDLKAPTDVEYSEIEGPDEDRIRGFLAAGKNVEGSMCYDCWSVWKTEGGWSGELAQYRSVTESFENVDTDTAVATAYEWACEC